MHSFLVNIRISQHMKVMFTLGFSSVNITVLWLTNPDVNLKRMHQLYNVESKTGMISTCLFASMLVSIVVCLGDQSICFADFDDWHPSIGVNLRGPQTLNAPLPKFV